jgi:hypothetical protein
LHGDRLVPRPPRCTTTTCALILLVVTAASAVAHADEILRGVVVRVEAGEVYFDLGTATGLQPGAPLRLKRRIALTHPVSGVVVADDLPLGDAKVARVGATLSMAQPSPALAAALVPGDLVEAYLAKDPPAPVEPSPSPPPEPMPSLDRDTAEVLSAWTAAAGRPIGARIAVWEGFLHDHPRSPYAARAAVDLEALRAIETELSEGEPEATAHEPVVRGLRHAPPRHGAEHAPLPLAFVAERPDESRAAWVHYRRRGADTFRKTELHRDGDGYLRGTIPAAEVEAPGAEYFVEVALAGGTVAAAVGTPDEPLVVAVAGAPSREIYQARPSRSRVSIQATYLDYATFDTRAGDHTDTFFLVETDFLYRLRTWIYGLRIGFGVLEGKGGSADGTMPRATGFNYGYWEVEFRPAGPNVALLARGVAGLGDDGLGFGAEGRVRLGPEDATNITFAASTLAGIGFLSEAKLQWAVIPAFPLGFAVAVTNQPNNGDLGVRLSADIGMRIRRWLQPTIRVSYQGRTLSHSGLGGGLGLVFDW